MNDSTRPPIHTTPTDECRAELAAEWFDKNILQGEVYPAGGGYILRSVFINYIRSEAQFSQHTVNMAKCVNIVRQCVIDNAIPDVIVEAVLDEVKSQTGGAITYE